MSRLQGNRSNQQSPRAQTTKAVHKEEAFWQAATNWSKQAREVQGLDILSRCKKFNEFLSKVCIRHAGFSTLSCSCGFRYHAPAATELAGPAWGSRPGRALTGCAEPCVSRGNCFTPDRRAYSAAGTCQCRAAGHNSSKTKHSRRRCCQGRHAQAATNQPHYSQGISCFAGPAGSRATRSSNHWQVSCTASMIMLMSLLRCVCTATWCPANLLTC